MVEVFRRLDAIPLLVTLLGFYWLSTTLTLWSDTALYETIVDPTNDEIENIRRPETSPSEPQYLILSDAEQISEEIARQTFIARTDATTRVSIEQFQIIDTDYWGALSIIQRQELLDETNLLNEDEVIDWMLSNSDTSNSDIVRAINRALIRRLTLLEPVRDKSGQLFIFTGSDFIPWEAEQQYLLLPINVLPEHHCRDSPILELCDR